MFIGDETHQWLIELRRFFLRVLAPCACVRIYRIGELVYTEVLVLLICVVIVYAWSVYQRQVHIVRAGLVPSVFAVIDD